MNTHISKIIPWVIDHCSIISFPWPDSVYSCFRVFTTSNSLWPSHSWLLLGSPVCSFFLKVVLLRSFQITWYISKISRRTCNIQNPYLSCVCFKVILVVFTFNESLRKHLTIRVPDEVRELWLNITLILYFLKLKGLNISPSEPRILRKCPPSLMYRNSLSFSSIARDFCQFWCTSHTQTIEKSSF